MNLMERLEQGLPILDVDLFTVGGTTVSAAHLVAVLFVVIATFVISHVIDRGLRRLFEARGMDEGTSASFRRLVHYVVLIVGFGIAVHTMGINLTALFATGAIFAVALGFAMQNMTSNFVSGLVLLLERVIKPGDVLEVEGRMVKVRHMSMRATIARTLDDEDVIVPNSTLMQSTVKNYTFRDSIYRVRVDVGVVYGSDMKLVRHTLERATESLSWRVPQRAPVILMTAFGDSAVNFEVSVWIDDPWSLRRRISDLHECIWWALKSADVVIAFPQLDVHFDPPVMETMTSLRRAG